MSITDHLLDCNVQELAGPRVVDPVEALALTGQEAMFRPMRGMRLVTMKRP